ncbi:hypothetical protein HH310_06900 [Actinoplanes sp. TBRC 11911]|uniref:hypothetical protein n=1 Tax=Actinoplanes sp. TBRC 11911 TaxID=2729386 RepID=UPI00145E64B2|nr:hypothetical protein [Actinoplanes sp. TBRC 11911]NMO50919.1 hypothetical protein [Actinoplanes sp. TBRC 11911]
MWLEVAPEKTATLRQGDLLAGLCLPKLSWPLHYARGPEEPPAADQPVVLQSIKQSYYIVVSQCCTIEQRGVLSLARVSRISARSDEERQALALEVPSKVEGGPKYSFNSHPLAALPGHLEENEYSVHAADFTTIQTYASRVTELQDKRVAGMTPSGRRLLRIRLQFFWGRVEAEDLAWFESQGLPPGL